MVQRRMVELPTAGGGGDQHVAGVGVPVDGNASSRPPDWAGSTDWPSRTLSRAMLS